MKKYYQGKFKPKNPNKYNGNPNNIIYRSSFELKFMMQIDHDKNVVSWASEELIVNYIHPIKESIARYFPDFIVKTTDGKTRMIEIKPAFQCQPPIKSKRMTKTYITEVANYSINKAKWEAAKKFCEQRGWEFVVLTEKELGIKF